MKNHEARDVFISHLNDYIKAHWDRAYPNRDEEFSCPMLMSLIILKVSLDIEKSLKKQDFQIC